MSGCFFEKNLKISLYLLSFQLFEHRRHNFKYFEFLIHSLGRAIIVGQVATVDNVTGNNQKRLKPSSKVLLPQHPYNNSH
jgi:hypothetical protein